MGDKIIIYKTKMMKTIALLLCLVAAALAAKDYHTSDLSRGSDSDCNYRSQIDKWQRMGNQKDTLVLGLYSASAKRFENGKPSMANNGMPFSVQQLMCIWPPNGCFDAIRRHDCFEP